MTLICAMTISMVACKSNKDDKATVEATDAAAESGTTDYEYDVFEYVTLGEYKGIEVTLEGDYEYTDEGLDEFIIGKIGAGEVYIKDSDSTEIKDDSYVNVDYCGTQDGVAFGGGTATDVTLDIANNGDVSGTSYIPGFTTGLAGHKVGEEVAYEVAFPENYGNAELAGQTVTFTFTVNYIAKAVDVTKLTDEQKAEYLNYDDVDSYKEAMKSEYEEKLASNKESDTRTSVINTVVNGAKVDLSAGKLSEVLDARVESYLKSMEEYYCQDGSTLEEFITNSGDDYEATVATIKENFKTTFEQQLIFQAIAEKEGITIDEEDYKAYIEELLSGYGATDVQQLYDSYSVAGFSGESYMRLQYLDQQAAQFCVENAVVSEK